MSDTHPRIALVSARAAHGVDEDFAPLQRALREAGADAQSVDWDDPDVDWGRFTLAVLRSTWDYTTRVPEFLAWAREVSSRTQLINPFPLVRWNADKHYLRDLAAAGVPVIPSLFIEPGQDAGPLIEQAIGATQAKEIVVKPAIGAGSKDAQRHERSSPAALREHAGRLLDEGRSVLLQPYLDSVDERGETALVFYAGRFSHAIRKGALLRPGEAAMQSLFAPEQISASTPLTEELQVAERVLAAVPFGTPLYARVDLLMDARGTPTLLELELIEPSMFFAHAPGAADRFARALLNVSPR